MKIYRHFKPKPKLVNQFGQALLIESNGRHRLIGGTATELTAAKEWIPLFAHEVVFSPTRQNEKMRLYFVEQ